MMKHLFRFGILGFVFIIFSCKTTSKPAASDSNYGSDKIVIANAEQEFEVIIYDANFEPWLKAFGKPRGYYSQSYLENKNQLWVAYFNAQTRSGKVGYYYIIDYKPRVDYGYEVNYLLYHYLLYWQTQNGIQFQ